MASGFFDYSVAPRIASVGCFSVDLAPRSPPQHDLMIAENQIIPDDDLSRIGGLLSEFRKHQPGTRSYRGAKTELIEKLKLEGYRQFRGDPRLYHIQRIGHSYLYWVPRNKRGHLKRFRGKLIRILVIARGGGRMDRLLMAGEADVPEASLPLQYRNGPPCSSGTIETRWLTGATVTVEWGYESHTITLTARNWSAIKAGKPHRQRGKGYKCEGQFFWDYWSFEGGLGGALEVGYGNDGAEGFAGRLADAQIQEHTEADHRLRKTPRSRARSQPKRG